jgi:drug/metabolite transporter (DMT)-like permease
MRWPAGAISITCFFWAIDLIGLLTATLYLMVNVAYRKLSTATASIMTMLILPITVVIAVLYFHEPLTTQKIMGGLLIAAAGIGASVVPAPSQKASIVDPDH